MPFETGLYFKIFLARSTLVTDFTTTPFVIQRHKYPKLTFEEAVAKINSSFKIRVGFISMDSAVPIKLTYNYGKTNGTGRFTIGGKVFCKFMLKG